MKTLKYIASTILLLVLASSCYDDGTDYRDEATRIVMTPESVVFNADGTTADGDESFVAIVKVREGGAVSSLSWDPSITGADWAHVGKTSVASQFTEAESGAIHDVSEDGIEVKTDVNTGYRRSFSVNITASDGTVKTYAFTQLGARADAAVSSNTKELLFMASGGTESVTYSTNMGTVYNYDIKYEGTSEGWLTIKDNGVGSFDVTASEWSDKEKSRTAIITIHVGSLSTSEASLKIPVTQNAAYTFYYLYGASANGLSIDQSIEMSRLSPDVYRASTYFMNANSGKNPVLLNMNGRTVSYPCYAVAKDGTVKEIASASVALPDGPTIDIDGMRTITVNFNSMTWEWQRITGTNCLPDSEVSKYATVTYTANGRTKTWMRTCLNWNGGENIGAIKLGSRMVTPANNVGGYTHNQSSYESVRVSDYDEVESGGKAQGEVEATEKYGRIYTLREFLSGSPTGALDIERLLADWPEPYHPGSTFTDAVGNEITMKNYTAITNVDEPTLTMQIQGICPYGWHAANVQDFFDMLTAACEAKGVAKVPVDKMIGSNWQCADVLRCAEGWSTTPDRIALADTFGFDLYPQGRRLFNAGFQNYGVYGEMFMICPGGIGSQGAYQSWRIQTLKATGTAVQVSTTYNIGDCAASFRCVKNYK